MAPQTGQWLLTYIAGFTMKIRLFQKGISLYNKYSLDISNRFLKIVEGELVSFDGGIS